MDFKQEALWIIGVDRRRIVLLAFKSRKILHPSIIAEEVKRSIQNISHALHEMEERGFSVTQQHMKLQKKWLVLVKQ